MTLGKLRTGSAFAVEEHDLSEATWFLESVGDADSDVESVLATSSTSTQGADVTEPFGESNIEPLLSVGSAMHGTGSCKPCGFFWKSQGCQNGRACHHCHLCPWGEGKALKKAKKMLEKAPHIPSTPEVGFVQPPVQQPLQMMPFPIAGIRPPPGLEDVHAAPCWTPAAMAQSVKPTLSVQLAEVIIGSKQHGRSDCKPCARFWKPQGCQNGAQCEFDDLCSADEIKLQRKVKQQVLLSQANQEKTYFEEVASLADTFSENEQPVIGKVSVGSAYHGTGKCTPCTWFWKPQGCQRGEDCLHCHLCPKGEFRRRKKALQKSKMPVVATAELSQQQQVIFQQRHQLAQMQMHLFHQQVQMHQMHQMLSGQVAHTTN
eukprot:TRINITY_DN1830_c0_g1_i1.p1 TRINITY_DN1830_c0_g1~~TRINITY_DN1830_c0_g1_i1.p1  ORF type:complete len:374 (+),score=70.41 TRINITY_DN1830_c0_g1_i1:75-1196(+)